MSSSSAAETHDKTTGDEQVMMDIEIGSSYLETINQNGALKEEQVRTCEKAMERIKVKPDEPGSIAANIKRYMEEFDSEHRVEIDELWSIAKIADPKVEKVINESQMKTQLDKLLKSQPKKIRRFTSDTCKNNLIANMKEIRNSLADSVVKHGGLDTWPCVVRAASEPRTPNQASLHHPADLTSGCSTALPCVPWVFLRRCCPNCLFCYPPWPSNPVLSSSLHRPAYALAPAGCSFPGR